MILAVHESSRRQNDKGAAQLSAYSSFHQPRCLHRDKRLRRSEVQKCLLAAERVLDTASFCAGHSTCLLGDATRATVELLPEALACRRHQWRHRELSLIGRLCRLEASSWPCCGPASPALAERIHAAPASEVQARCSVSSVTNNWTTSVSHDNVDQCRRHTTVPLRLQYRIKPASASRLVLGACLVTHCQKSMGGAIGLAACAHPCNFGLRVGCRVDVEQLAQHVTECLEPRRFQP